ncbi:MAG TPA: hypothetical protein VEC37_09935 [Bacillota bacterium]|nr:hypothetical protein [Bacillota bacterium]
MAGERLLILHAILMLLFGSGYGMNCSARIWAPVTTVFIGEYSIYDVAMASLHDFLY